MTYISIQFNKFSYQHGLVSRQVLNKTNIVNIKLLYFIMYN